MEEAEVLYQEQLFRDRRQSKQKTFKAKADKIIEISDIAQEIEDSKVTTLLRLILVLSVLADVLGLVPILGSISGIIFAVIFFILYFINGLGKSFSGKKTKKFVRQRVTLWIIRAFFLSAEGLPVLGIIPFFTITALVEMALSQRKVKKLINKIEKLTNK